MTLPAWAVEHWPSTHHRTVGWRPIVTHHALAMRVLCVATTRIEGAWCAYCDAVPGMRHDDEVTDVLCYGDKLPEAVALALFPDWEGIPYDK